jgi:predicted MFS family arabinose efflux permease
MRMSTTGVVRPPLRTNREFWLMWVGQAASTLGSHSSAIAIPVLVLALTRSPAAAGLVGFVSTAAVVVLLPFAGVIADQVNRRRLMRWCDAGRAAAMAALALTLAVGRLPLLELVGVVLVNGSLTALFTAAHGGALRQVVASADLSTAVARTQAYQQAAVVGGPPLGGLLYGIARLLPFLTDAISYLVSYLAITAIGIPLQDGHHRAEVTPIRHRLLDGLRWVLGEPFLRAACLYAGVLCFIQPALVLTVIVRATTAGASSTMVGIIFALSGVSGVAGALAAPRISQRWRPGVALLAIGGVWTITIPLLALTSQPILLGVILLPLGFTAPAANTVIISYQMAITPDRLQGQAYAAMNLITSIPAPLGSLAGGLVLTAIGSTGSVFVLTTITAGTVLVGCALGALRTSGRIPSTSTSAPTPSSGPAKVSRDDSASES